MITKAAQTYRDMTDEELVAFVAANLPHILWRIEKRPRCALHRDLIIAEIARTPLFRVVRAEETSV